jgi:addiction module HigA family antidote
MKLLHRGEVLREEFLQPMGITACRLTKDINVPLNRITAIVNEERASRVSDTSIGNLSGQM